MTDTKDTTTNTTTVAPQSAPEVPAAAAPVERQGNSAHNRRGGGGRNPRRNTRREERPRSEFDQKTVSVRRVARVMAGGRRFSFSVALVIGDRKGQVGVGTGKAGDTALAIDKAMRDAKKNMLKLKLSKTMSLPYDTKAKYASSEILLFPAPGKGLVAGSSVRTVLELAGVKDVSAKILSRSKNQLNNARAAIKALEAFSM